ncbi:MAG: hypothetical protein R2832_16855 [Rhodothermales bacterium]
MDSRSAAIRAFCDGLFDYAGLFPPAALDLRTAVAAYRQHREARQSWMLGAFVVPAAQLADLDQLLESEEQIDLSVLVATRATSDAYFDTLRHHLDFVRLFVAEDPVNRKVAGLETRAPQDVKPETFIDDVTKTVLNAGLDPGCTFIEVALDLRSAELDRWTKSAAARRTMALKARCGGVSEQDVPSSESVAAYLIACHANGCRTKFTAGLHHPIRGMHHTGSVPMHGFINVIGGAMLAGSVGDATGLSAIVSETDAAAFGFNEAGFSWRGHSVDETEVRRCRHEFALSIGSCSFDEPIEDLTALNILPRPGQ